MCLKILCVDDEKDILLLYKSLFQRSGFTVTTADNGLDALLLLNKGKFDLVLTDIKMPVIDGIELSKKIKKLKMNTKVVGITGYDYNFNQEELKSIGMEGIIKKNTDINLITETIKKIFRGGG